MQRSLLSEMPLTAGSWYEGSGGMFLVPVWMVCAKTSLTARESESAGLFLWTQNHGNGCSLLCSISLIWLERKAEYCMCHTLGTRHSWSLSSRMLLHLVPPDWLPNKAKKPQCWSLGLEWFGQPGTRAGHGCLLPTLTWVKRLPKTPPVGQARPFTHLDWKKGNTGRVFFRRLLSREAGQAPQRNFLHDTDCRELVLV